MDLILAATSITPERSVGFTLTVIIAGLGIVLGTLALLILVFAVFGKAVFFMQAKAQLKKAQEMQKKAQNAIENILKNEVPPPPPVPEAQGTPPEVIAAITAAVYAYEGGEVKITSIKRKKAEPAGRSPWAQAAIIHNTKPF